MFQNILELINFKPVFLKEGLVFPEPTKVCLLGTEEGQTHWTESGLIHKSLHGPSCGNLLSVLPVCRDEHTNPASSLEI